MASSILSVAGQILFSGRKAFAAGIGVLVNLVQSGIGTLRSGLVRMERPTTDSQ